MRLLRGHLNKAFKRGISLVLVIGVLLPCLNLGVFADSYGTTISDTGSESWQGANGNIVMAENEPIILRIFMADPYVYDEALTDTTRISNVGASEQRYDYQDQSVFVVLSPNATSTKVPLCIGYEDGEVVAPDSDSIFLGSGSGAFYDLLRNKIFSGGAYTSKMLYDGGDTALGTRISEVYTDLKSNRGKSLDNLKAIFDNKFPGLMADCASSSGDISFIIEPLIAVRDTDTGSLHSYWTAFGFIQYVLEERSVAPRWGVQTLILYLQPRK